MAKLRKFSPETFWGKRESLFRGALVTIGPWIVRKMNSFAKTYGMQNEMTLGLPQIRACLFDFGGTLDSDGMTWGDRFYPIYLRHGIKVNRDAFRKAFFFADDRLIEQRTLVDADLQKTIESQVSLVLEHLGFPQKEKKAMIARSFLDDMIRIIERNRDLLKRLSSCFRMGIISNFYGNLERVCEDLGIQSFFDVIVDSTIVGVMKPDPKIFQAALEGLEIAPHQGIFVGDNQFRDMVGAKAVGLPHVWLAAPSANPPQPCCPNDWIISSLLELKRLLLVEGDNPPLGVSV